MPRRTTEENKPYFVTLTVVDWVDVFTRSEYADLVIENLRYCQQNKGLDLYAYVIMSNHLHLVASSRYESLNKLLGHFKSYTSKELIKEISQNPKESRREWMLSIFEENGKRNKQNETYQFWQNENRPVLLYTEHVAKQKIGYIHQNPVRTGFVLEPEHYYYSSANPISPLKMFKLRLLD